MRHHLLHYPIIKKSVFAQGQLFQTPQVLSARHHFTSYIVVQREIYVNAMCFNISKCLRLVYIETCVIDISVTFHYNVCSKMMVCTWNKWHATRLCHWHTFRCRQALRVTILWVQSPLPQKSFFSFGYQVRLSYFQDGDSIFIKPRLLSW